MHPAPPPPPPPERPPAAPPRPQAAERAGPPWLGLLLIVPAGLACLAGYVWPTLRTIWNSFQERSLLRENPEFAGVDNYRLLTEDGLPTGFGFALFLALGLLLLLAVAAPVLAWAADRAGRPARLAARLALTLPIVCFAPAAVAVAWGADQESRFFLPDVPERFAELDRAPFSLAIIWWLSVCGLVCGIGVLFFLAALRGSRPGGSALPAGLTVAALAAVTAVAVAIQTFTYPYVITRGGPLFETSTPMLGVFQTGLVMFHSGAGAARAVLILLPLMLLGLVATLLVVLTGLRVEVEPGQRAGTGPQGWPAVRVMALIVTVAGLVTVLAAAAYGLWPWLSRLAQFDNRGPVGALLADTWLASLITAGFGVGLAALAGFGIGAVRPLGRHSEWLLLLFAPWLFIGIGPLFLTKVESAFESGRLDGFLGRIPPIWLVIPVLFLLTVLFRGLEGQRRATVADGGMDPGWGWVVSRSLPMVGLLFAATWVVQAQSPLWGVLAGGRSTTAPAWLVQQQATLAADPDELPFGLVLPIPVIVVMAIGFGLLQLLYLDRLALRVGLGGPLSAPVPPAGYRPPAPYFAPPQPALPHPAPPQHPVSHPPAPPPGAWYAAPPYPPPPPALPPEASPPPPLAPPPPQAPPPQAPLPANPPDSGGS